MVHVSVFDFHSKYCVHLKTALKVENKYSLLFGDVRFFSPTAGNEHMNILPFFLNSHLLCFLAGASCSSSTQTAPPPTAGEKRQNGGGGDHTGVTDRKSWQTLIET